jgi:16S rRNA (guanine527-N7)-methyltransferase
VTNRAEDLRAGLVRLAARFDLPETAADQLAALTDLLATDPTAPTTVTSPQAVLRDHLADSLMALELPPVAHAERIADLGSGAGFPGLPLAIALPSTTFFLVESSRRKCQFLERAIAGAKVTNTVVVPTRVESWAEERGQLDVVTVRAVASLSVVAEYAAPLLKTSGTLVAWRGRRDPAAEAQAVRAAAELGLEVREPIEVQPYPEAEHRYLHLMSKVRDTPAQFPRRPGVAAKRPLGTSDRARR